MGEVSQPGAALRLIVVQQTSSTMARERDEVSVEFVINNAAFVRHRDVEPSTFPPSKPIEMGSIGCSQPVGEAPESVVQPRILY